MFWYATTSYNRQQQGKTSFNMLQHISRGWDIMIGRINLLLTNHQVSVLLQENQAPAWQNVLYFDIKCIIDLLIKL